MDITTFSDEQLAGQRLMVGFEGTELNQELEFFIDEIKVGGIILFARNLIDPRQIEQLCSEAQAYAHSKGQPPLLIAIDQEGGQVARLPKPFTRFAGNPTMKSRPDAEHFAKVTAAELSRAGINMNMAPVLDVAFDTSASIMAGRAFGNDPQWVADLGTTVIEHLQKNQIMAVAKHFPGIGRTTSDSHLDRPDLDIDFDTLMATDLLPFEAAITSKVAGIMLSHIRYRQLDTQWPASLSPFIAGDLLRDRMGFDGIVLTDDLDMGAVKKHYDIKSAIHQILLADIDIALICHSRPDIESAFNQVLNSYASSQALKEKGKESAGRILALKQKYLAK